MRKVYPILLSLLTTFFLISKLPAQMIMGDCTAHPTDPIMQAEHCEVLALVPIGDATTTAIHNGSWFSPGTWSTGQVPIAGSNVLIDSGVVVTYDAVSELAMHWLRVNGTLQFSTTVNTKLKLNTFIVDPLGVVTMGTELTPVLPTVTTQVVFSDDGPIDTNWDPHLFSKGLVSHGTFTAYGAYKKSFIGINNGVSAGATAIKLAETPTGWAAGDHLVLAGTDAFRAGSDATNTKFHDEELTITSISGKTVYFTNNANGSNALLYDHKPPSGFGLKVYIANLTRNVSFSTEHYETVPISQRGHVMLMHNTNQNMYYVSFNGLGRTDKTQIVTDPVVDDMGMLISGGENPRGRYSCHVHRAGTNMGGIDPVNIQGCAVYDTPGWGFVNHSSNVVMEDNVVYQFRGAAFVTEAGDELGAFRRNMAIKGTGELVVTAPYERVAAFDMGYEGNGFWMQTANIEYEDNIAASCAGMAYELFSDDASFTSAHRPLIPVANILSPVIAGAQDSIFSALIPIRKNKGSIAYNCLGGMFFWTHLFNSDNVGDFSSLQNAPYSHNAFSVLEDFKFWNMLEKGIDVTYSAQVYFKDGLLLGDMDNRFQGTDWTSTSEDFGHAVIGNLVTGQFIYDDMNVQGWKRGIMAFRSDDLVGTDDDEYDYRISKVLGGYFDHNDINIYPEPALNEDYLPNFNKFPKYFEISGSPVFNTTAANTLPTANFSYATTGGLSVQMNGSLSSDPDPVVANDGNGIVSYEWNFGDGKTGSGVDPVHTFPSAGTYSVGLTVYDSQGQTTSLTKNVYVLNTAYKNILSDPGFEKAPLIEQPSMTSVKSFVAQGWLKKGEWQIDNGKAVIYKSEHWYRPLVDAIKNDSSMRGDVEFSFQAKNLGIGATGNNLKVEVYGVDGEYQDPDLEQMNNIQKWYNNDNTFHSSLLFSEEFGLASYDWQTFKRTIHFGTGHEYIIIKFYSTGIKSGAGESQGVDNVCLPCNCTVPQNGQEDDLTSTHATLIWDNVGAPQYQLQYKKVTGGGAWTTATVDNTFYELNSLLPGTTYQWKVQALCDGAWTPYSTVRKFITPVAGSLCTSPVDLFTSLITGNQATLNWNAVPGEVQYQASYKKVGMATWTNINTSNNSLTVTGLLPGSSYQWKVRTQCSEGWKAFTNFVSFATPATRDPGVDAQSEAYRVEFFPNPANEQVTLNLFAPASAMINVTITDIVGRNVMVKQYEVAAGNQHIDLDVHNIATGVYILQVSDGHSLDENNKLIIE